MPDLDLEPAAAEVSRLLDGVTDAQLGDPTPCAGTPVAGLLDHLLGLSLAFTWAARKSDPEGLDAVAPGPGPDAAANLDPDWRALLPKRLDDLVDAWRDPAAWTGLATAGGVTMPAEIMGVVAADELVLHGWDLARATGQTFTCDPALAEPVLEFTRATAQPDQTAAREGLFGPAVPVPDDAPVLDRALGFSGRDPAWAPPSGRG